MDVYEGGCRCGNLRIKASGRPLRVGICHCLDCRKHHGALFYAAAVFRMTELRFPAKRAAMLTGSFALAAALRSLRAAELKWKCILGALMRQTS